MPDLLLENPNPHLLDRVLSLADSKEVVAAEDIYTDKGVKLLARGSQLDRSMQERLLVHKLKRPLLQSLSVAEGVTVEALVLLAGVMLEEQSMLAPLCEQDAQVRLAKRLAAVPLDRVSLLLLTLSHHTEGAAMRHSLLVTLIALGLGRSMKLPVDIMGSLVTAALLHDVGELYIDPAVLEGSHKVTPDEWRSVAVHPVVGHRLLRETTGLGETAARIVLEHHERIDGSGYPRGLSGAVISPAGQVLAAAEMVVGLLGKTADSSIRLDLALKVVSSGHSPPIMLHLRDCLLPNSAMAGLPLYSNAGVLNELNQLIQTLAVTHGALERAKADAGSVRAQALIVDAEGRYGVVRQAFLRTGLGSIPAAEISAMLADTPAAELAEAMGIVAELNWRLRELSRFVALRIGMVPADERGGLEALLVALADPLKQALPA
ncbi:HD-GYP domain-containing protein [Chitinimonas naiadis]